MSLLSFLKGGKKISIKIVSFSITGFSHVSEKTRMSYASASPLRRPTLVINFEHINEKYLNDSITFQVKHYYSIVKHQQGHCQSLDPG